MTRKGLLSRILVGALVVLLAAGVLWRRVRQRLPKARLTPIAKAARFDGAPPRAESGSIFDIGPRLISNRTSTPVLVMGQGLVAGDVLVFGPPASLEVKLAQADGPHGWARIPPIDLSPELSEADVPVSLKKMDGTAGTGQARLTVVNDRHFPDPIGLAVAGYWACAISTNTDGMTCAAGKAVKPIGLADGPSAITSTDAAFLVGYEFTPQLWLVEPPRFTVTKIAGPPGVTGLAYDARSGTAYVAEHIGNTLQAIDLASGGKVRWVSPIDPGPGRVALAGDLVAVAGKQTGEVQLLRADDGTLVASLSPGPGIPIVGGHTAKYSKYVMGGLPVRDLAYSRKLGLLFVASSGPNIGPNPDRMEVSTNGGITVIDPRKAKVRYHLGFDSGVTESLALDDERGLLYASDVALGLVRVLDLKRLAAGPKGAERALLSTTPIPPPADFVSILPPAQLGRGAGHRERAGVELHSGPKALAFGVRGATGPKRGQTDLFAIDRLSGTLAHFDISARGQAVLEGQLPLFDMLAQPERRKGEVIYYSDVGLSGMSCDACHVDGHVGDLLFSKTRPIRLYRATSVRGSRETPPYFIPASEEDLAGTASFVGSRNRYQNPSMSDSEIRELALFTSEIPTPPNPFVEDDGSLPASLVLPDGERGDPSAGIKVFFGKARCQTCHPGPLFTSDESPHGRGRYVPVGTPDRFPLRTDMQDEVSPDFPAQSLNGIWDLFPLLTTGTAGFGVKDGRLYVETRFPLRAVLDHRGPVPHGAVADLTKAEENDLLAFLMTL
jgi:hypothetical protein